MLFTSVATIFTILSVLIVTASPNITRSSAAEKMTTVRLPITADNEVNSYFPTVVTVNSPYANVGHMVYHNVTYRYYLDIDTSAIPKNAKILKATLILDRASSSFDQDGTYELHPVLAAWETSILNWKNQPAYADEYVKGEPLDYGNYAFDVTRFYQSERSTNQYFGFVLKKPVEAGDNAGLFATSDYSTGGAENIPYLEVIYKGRN